MIIDLKNLTPEQARRLEEHERLHKEALTLSNRRKQFKLEMDKHIGKILTSEEN